MNVIENILTGAAAGCAATVPMTAVMALGYESLPFGQSDPLPPRQITERALQTVEAHDDLASHEKQALAMLNHFGFGTSMGALFGAVVPVRSQTDAVVKGMAFGCGVWAGSYLGWLPATGLYRSATREPDERNVLIVAAHLVWGASLGYAYYRFKNRSRADGRHATARPSR